MHTSQLLQSTQLLDGLKNVLRPERGNARLIAYDISPSTTKLSNSISLATLMLHLIIALMSRVKSRSFDKFGLQDTGKPSICRGRLADANPLGIMHRRLLGHPAQSRYRAERKHFHSGKWIRPPLLSMLVRSVNQCASSTAAKHSLYGTRE